MEQMKSGSIVVLLVLLCLTLNGRFSASNVTPGEGDNRPLPKEEKKQLQLTDQIVSYVCTVTNLFLEKVVQRKRLTDMVNVVDMSNVFAFIASLTSSWNDWTKYMIGFVLLFALFVVLGIAVLLFDIIYLICLFRGNCFTKSEQSEPPSKGCKIGCSVALTLVAVGLIVGGIAMFTTNEVIRTELSNVFDDLLRGVNHITDFLDLTVISINDTIFGGFVRLEDSVFSVLQNAPMKATETIANSTRGVTSSLNQLKNLTRQLDALKDTQNLTQVFGGALKPLTDAIRAVCLPPLCNLSSLLQGNSFNFDPFNIGSASDGLDRLVSMSLGQLTGIHSLMNLTMSVAVTGLKATTKGVNFGLATMISNLNTTLRGVVNVSLIRDLVRVVEQLKLYKLVTELSYWSMFALASIIGIIALLDLLGLMIGWCLPSNNAPNSGINCGCTKSIGSHLLMTGTGLTLFFFWIFALLVASLLVVGGPIHTEVCRNIVYNFQPESASVLAIFDEWIVGFLKFLPLRIKPFNIYSVCQNNRPIYEALNLTQIIDISQINNTVSMIEKMTESFGGMRGKLPAASLASPDLTSVLGTLTSGLGPSSFNFTKLYAMIENNSMLNGLVSLMNDTRNPFHDLLQPIYQQNVVPLLSERDRLLTKMRSAEAILNQISFTNITNALVNADTIMKKAIPTFLSSTTDSILGEIKNYVTGVIKNLEQEVGKCQLVHSALKIVVDALCVDILYPFNGFWFGLAWCTLFLIPNIILSVYLASAYNASASMKSVGHLYPKSTKDSEKNISEHVYERPHERY